MFTWFPGCCHKQTNVTFCGFCCASYVPLYLNLKLGLLRTVVDSSFLVIPLEQATCPQCFIKCLSPKIADLLKRLTHMNKRLSQSIWWQVLFSLPMRKIGKNCLQFILTIFVKNLYWPSHKGVLLLLFFIYFLEYSSTSVGGVCFAQHVFPCSSLSCASNSSDSSSTQQEECHWASRPLGWALRSIFMTWVVMPFSQEKLCYSTVHPFQYKLV